MSDKQLDALNHSPKEKEVMQILHETLECEGFLEIMRTVSLS